MSEEAADFTRDTFYHGRVVLFQPQKGYRFSIDAPILADFLPRGAAPALEVGCGCGVVSLLALHAGKFPHVTGLEIQPRLAEAARRNAAANGLGERFTVVEGDFCAIGPRFRGAAVIFANPPFFSPGDGRLPPHPEVRTAKFEITLTTARLLQTAAAVLAADGSLFLIFPERRRQELLHTAAACGLHPALLRRIQPFADGKADRFVVQLKLTAQPPVEKEPLILFQHQGVYSPEMEKILAGNGHD